jgi:hypothetical protein
MTGRNAWPALGFPERGFFREQHVNRRFAWRLHRALASQTCRKDRFPRLQARFAKRRFHALHEISRINRILQPGPAVTAPPEGKGCVWRNDVDGVRRDHRFVFGFNHRHRGHFADEIGEQALVIGREVLDQHEGHATVGQHIGEESLEGAQSAGRCADTDDQ